MSAKALSVTASVLVMDFEIQKAGILLCRGFQDYILEPSLYNVEKCDYLPVVWLQSIYIMLV